MPFTPFATQAGENDQTADRASSERRQAIADVAALRASGLAFVELVTDEEPGGCDACRAVARTAFALDRTPLPPVPGCEVGCRCRIAPLWLE